MSWRVLRWIVVTFAFAYIQPACVCEGQQACECACARQKECNLPDLAPDLCSSCSWATITKANECAQCLCANECTEVQAACAVICQEAKEERAANETADYDDD